MQQSRVVTQSRISPPSTGSSSSHSRKLKENGASKLYDDIFNGMLHCRPDRLSVEHRETAERCTTIVFYIMMYTQSQRSNWLHRDLCAFLHYHGMSDAGLYALHNMGLGVGHTTFYRQMHQAVVEHRLSIVGERNQAITKKCLMIVTTTQIYTRNKNKFNASLSYGHRNNKDLS